MTFPPDQETVTLRDDDYRYGAGPLTLRLEHVDRGRPLRIDGDDWYVVIGVEIGWDGDDRDRREVLVRAGRLPPPDPLRSSPYPVGGQG
jgi:hypothetical protein